jgi:hypothetical protein
LCCLVVSAPAVYAWTLNPAAAMQKAFAVASVSAALATAPAVDTDSSSFFNGSFSDPKHPNCQRVVAVTPGTNQATVQGTDGSPGCPPDGSGKPWRLTATIDADKIFVDFSPKGGPKGLQGTWEQGGLLSPSGIRWGDGNLWALKGGENKVESLLDAATSLINNK